jgi:hypothetical protein
MNADQSFWMITGIPSATRGGCLFSHRFALTDVDGLSQDPPPINAIESGAERRAVSCADHVTADLFEENANLSGLVANATKYSCTAA